MSEAARFVAAELDSFPIRRQSGRLRAMGAAQYHVVEMRRCPQPCI
jgi:hypothetical protein